MFRYNKVCDNIKIIKLNTIRFVIICRLKALHSAVLYTNVHSSYAKLCLDENNYFFIVDDQYE